MNIDNLKIGKCPECNMLLDVKDFEYKNDEELKARIIKHVPCGFEIVEELYNVAIEQGKKEVEAREAINKINLTPTIFRMFVERFLVVNGGWKLEKLGNAQFIKNQKGGPTDFFLAIPFSGKPKKIKGQKRGVNQGKGRGHTKPLKNGRKN